MKNKLFIFNLIFFTPVGKQTIFFSKHTPPPPRISNGLSFILTGVKPVSNENCLAPTPDWIGQLDEHPTILSIYLTKVPSCVILPYKGIIYPVIPETPWGRKASRVPSLKYLRLPLFQAEFWTILVAPAMVTETNLQNMTEMNKI